jgi:hypothetical protein
MENYLYNQCIVNKVFKAPKWGFAFHWSELWETKRLFNLFFHSNHRKPFRFLLLNTDKKNFA